MAGPFPGEALADEELDYGLETHKLAKIQISGNSTFSAGELKNLLQIQEATWTRPLHVAKYRPRLVDAQVTLLETFYRNRGFHQVSAILDSISTEADEGDVLHISIVEGQRTIIAGVSFEGNDPVPEEKLRASMFLLEGKPAPADLNAYGGDIYAIRDMYRNEAYLDALVRPELVIHKAQDGPGYQAYMTYHIQPGNNYTIGTISLAGNLVTRDNLLYREMLVHEGEPLCWQKVED
jgi:outer membrane protein assembly factor BamA